MGAENKLQPAELGENSPCPRWAPRTPLQSHRVLLLLPAGPGPQPVGKGREKAELTAPTPAEHKDTDPSVLFNWDHGLWQGGGALEPSPPSRLKAVWWGHTLT